MLQHLLKFKYDDKFLDATDGLAAAYCHFMQSKLNVNGKKSKGNNWKSFITQNPDRVKK
jgi:crossover junction endodeoxyribonuclease RuvC